MSADERAPLIGLTTYIETVTSGVWVEESAYLPMTYVAAVIRAGGCPVLLPPSPSPAAVVLENLAGLIVTGGPDVDPSLYGRAAHPQTEEPRPSRDQSEMRLLRSALQDGLPLLAICRGLQLLNVVRGGTLHQHLPDVTGSDLHRPEIGRMTPNSIRVEPDTAIARLLGTGVTGLCHHHQAIDRLGSGVRAVAFAAEGTIEGVEVEGGNFAVAVQWHPEEDPTDDRLFEGLVEAARRHLGQRSHAGEPPLLDDSAW